MHELSDYAEILTPASVAGWLAANDWGCAAQGPSGQIWTPISNPREALGIMLPTDQSYADYDRRLADAVLQLQEVFSWDLAELAENISSVHADLFFLRLDQTMRDGTIPFRQAAKLLESIDQMMKSAALVAYNPHHSGQGRAPSTVTDFLEQDLRMGHTKRGSFIITVAARHDNEEELHQEIKRKVEPLLEDGPDNRKVESIVERPTVPTFARRVMSTLNRSLVATRHHISTDHDFIDLESAVDAGVRLPLLEALVDIGQAEGLKSVDMRFDWSAFQPEPPDISSTVEFRAATFESVSVVSDRLRKEYEPRSETIAGHVSELKRSPDQEVDAEVGSVVVRAELDGRLRNVHVELSGSDYESAILAHHRRVPVILSGTLRNEKRSWILGGDVRLESHRIGTLANTAQSDNLSKP
ncbi:hypothetical protein [Arthrobacter sp. YD2]|uniref:hypothetical protein n=1 Tax=Arthrobacter sp. YD2 TaxID=3058046 RepID=UPI0025B3CEC7|nr:hypothetical protein [Arthrobacter sp. YD2]MDN3905784.1 hypothetical protein [Arthrobacter sp. YD2]